VGDVGRPDLSGGNMTSEQTRSVTEFSSGFVLGSLFIDPAKEEEPIVRLVRVGFDNVEGCLKGGFESWKKLVKKLI